LKKIGKNFENQLQQQGRSDRKRDKKHKDKKQNKQDQQPQKKEKPKKGASTFSMDREDGKKQYVPPKSAEDKDNKNINYFSKKNRHSGNKRQKK